jgi:hypothetical protein
MPNASAHDPPIVRVHPPHGKDSSTHKRFVCSRRPLRVLPSPALCAPAAARRPPALGGCSRHQRPGHHAAPPQAVAATPGNPPPLAPSPTQKQDPDYGGLCRELSASRSATCISILWRSTTTARRKSTSSQVDERRPDSGSSVEPAWWPAVRFTPQIAYGVWGRLSRVVADNTLQGRLPDDRMLSDGRAPLLRFPFRDCAGRPCVILVSLFGMINYLHFRMGVRENFAWDRRRCSVEQKLPECVIGPLLETTLRLAMNFVVTMSVVGLSDCSAAMPRNCAACSRASPRHPLEPFGLVPPRPSHGRWSQPPGRRASPLRRSRLRPGRPLTCRDRSPPGKPPTYRNQPPPGKPQSQRGRPLRR